LVSTNRSGGQRTERTTVSLRRVWRFSAAWWVACVLGSAVVGGIAFIVTPKPYEAHASLLLLSPPGGNPYVDDNPSLHSTVNIVAIKLSTPEVEASVGVPYSLALDDSINEPLMLISTKSQDPQRAQDALGTLKGLVTTTLTRLQAESSAPADATIRTQVLTETAHAEITRYEAIERAIIAMPAAFLAATFGRVLLRRFVQRRTPF
jgi:hypothetical protein